jgi:hypothetical protein
MRWSDKQAAWVVAAVHEFAFGTELPIPNVRSSVANGGKADNICSMRVLRILTDSVDKVPDERVEALY